MLFKVAPEKHFQSFKESLEGEDYFNEFYLNFGDNQISNSC